MKYIILLLVVAFSSVTYSVPSSVVNHSHNGRSHSHPLPKNGLNHKHNIGNKSLISKRKQRKTFKHKILKSDKMNIQDGWYVVFVSNDYVNLLNPETYRSYGSSVSYSKVTYDYSGQFSGERSEVRVEVECEKWISRMVSDVSVSDWKSGKFKKRFTPRGTWKVPKVGSVLDVETRWACLFRKQGRNALIAKLASVHDRFYKKIPKLLSY